MKRRFLDLAVAGVVLGIVQALVETAALALLHRDLLLPPYLFFPTHGYDAFTKLYFLVAQPLGLPSLLERFLAQGVTAKAALAPELVAINVGIAGAVAVLLTPLSGWLGVGRGRQRPLLVMALACAVVHVAVWATAFHPPEALSIERLAKAVARDVLQGGAAVAFAVLVASTLGASMVLAARGATAALLVAALGLSAFSAQGGPADAAPGAAPTAASVPAPAAGYNVILVSIDSLRADHMGAYGYQRDTSPTFDALARDGLLMRHCVSTTSWTLPAHMSILTGRSLLGHGVVSDDRSLPDSVPTLAESFQKAGYATHAIVSAPYVNSRYGFAKGFDEYDDKTIFFATNEDSYRSVTAPQLLEATTAFLDRPRDRPFFLFLHSWDVHYDYAPGAPWDTMFDPKYEGSMTGENFYFDSSINRSMDKRDLEHLLALYDGEIRMVDDHLAKLRRELERLGIAERTVIAIVADHGDEFFEHGNKGHHRTLYQEVIGVPCMVYVPGKKPVVPEVQSETSVIDIAPTLTALVGVAAPPGVEGRDLSGAFTGTTPADGVAVHAELYRTGTRNVQVAQIANRRKVIHHFQNRSLEAYDLSSDAGERSRLAPRGEVAAPEVASLRDWLDGRWKFFERRLRSEGIAPVVIDAKTAETLRSLGYLQ